MKKDKKDKAGEDIAAPAPTRKVVFLGEGSAAYLSPKDTLLATFEARLRKPEEEGCVIC